MYLTKRYNAGFTFPHLRLGVAITIVASSVLVLTGCERRAASAEEKRDIEMLRAGERYLDANSNRPGIDIWPTGEQFEVLDSGRGEKLTKGDYFVGNWLRVDFSGAPIFDGTGMLTIRLVDDFSLSALSYALTQIGVGGRVKVSIPWNRKGDGEFVSPEGPIFPDETVVWELSVLRKVDKGERELFTRGAHTEIASALVFNTCGYDEPDLLTKGSWNLADRGVLDPWNFAVRREDTVHIPLVSSTQRSWDKGDIRRNRWEWVGSCTGIFVLPGISNCKPEEIGEYIYGSGTGGQDWFGSYEAISMLDKDGNGWLEGEELAAVAVWVDGNKNGKPEEVEVRAAGSFIDRVSVKPLRVSRTAFARMGDGVIFKDGTKSSTWCWLTRGID